MLGKKIKFSKKKRIWLHGNSVLGNSNSLEKILNETTQKIK